MDKHRSRSRDPTVPQHDLETLIKKTEKVNYRRNQVMKKLLTILALAALLCLVCSAAMADTIIYRNYTVDDYTALANLVGNTVKVEGVDVTITSVPALSAVKKADHSADAYVNAYGKVGTNDCVVEIYMKTTHRALKKDTDLSKDATCGANGVLVMQCPDCSKSTSEVLEKTGNHTKKEVTVAATCLKGSHKDTICTVCGETLIAGAENNDKKAHDFTASTAKYGTSLDYWKVTRPVCSADSSTPKGTAERLCSGCKKTYKQATEDTTNTNPITGNADKQTWYLPSDFATYYAFMQARGEIIPATYDGHDWDNAVENVEADCVHAAGIKKWCKRCSTYVFEADKDSKPLAPVWVINSTDASPWNCKATSVDLKCSLCGGNKSIDHYVTGATVAKNVKTATDNNGFSSNQAAEQTYDSYIEATITGHSDNYKYTGIVLTVNVYHDWVEVDGTEKTVKKDKDGNALIDPCQVYKVKKVKCSLCSVGKHYIVSSAAPDHKYSSWKLIDDGNGNTETKRYERVCSACKQRQVRAFTDETLPVEHKADGSECTFVDDKDFKYTCGALNDVKMVCECGNTKIDYDRYVEHAPGAYSEIIYKAATCKEEGLKFWKCTNCNKDGKYEITAKTEDHAWDDGVITTPATKEADGVKTFTCKDCGTTKTEAVKYVVTADPKYTLKATYNGGVVSGNLAHVDDTKEAANQFVRVTFYIGTYYMATTAEVNADGTFAVEGVGPIDYITVVPTGNSAVNPSEVQRIGEAQEIFVK